MSELPENARPDRRMNAALDALARMARVMERSVPGMTLADFRVLSAVAEGEARASRLAHRLAVGKPSMSAAVDSLVRRGMLSRRAHATDQRAVDLAVTPDGREALAEAQRTLGSLLHAVAARTPDADVTLRALAALDDAVEEQMAAFHAARHARRTTHRADGACRAEPPATGAAAAHTPGQAAVHASTEAAAHTPAQASASTPAQASASTPARVTATTTARENA